MKYLEKTSMALLACACLSACATTSAGKLIRMPVDDVKNGNIFMATLETIAIPVLVPFLLVGDAVDAAGVDESTVAAVTQATTNYYVAKNQADLTQAQAAQAQQLAAQQAQMQQQASATSRQIPEYSPDPGVGTNNNSRVIAADGRPAMDCVRLETLARGDSHMGSGGRVLMNGCSDPVEITWCYVDTECASGRGAMWTVQPGRSWPVSAERELRWGACHGRNTAAFEKGSSGLRLICSAPL